MRHQRYGVKNTHEHGALPARAQQIEMIKRHYPEYCDDNWVLWIVAEVFHNTETVTLTGDIKIIKKDESLIDVPRIVRTPYPNKGLRQISLKSGRRRLYGIPLVFDTFEELSEVSHISIEWDIYEAWRLELGQQPLDLHVEKLLIDYDLTFKKDEANPEYRFFTVFSRDNKDDIFTDSTSPNRLNYFNEFDVAIGLDADFSFDFDEPEMYVNNLYDFKMDADGCSACGFESVFFQELEKIRPNMEKVNELLPGVVVQSELQWSVYHYQRTETLVATYLADIMPDESFGFLSREKLRLI